MKIFTAEPDNNLLREREDDEAYVAAVPGKQHAIYFPDGGEVKLDVKQVKGPFKLR